MTPKFIVKEERMGGENYHMIYWKWLWLELFFERWNTAESARIRLNELNGEHNPIDVRA